jgi:hypothetical protein
LPLQPPVPFQQLKSTEHNTKSIKCSDNLNNILSLLINEFKIDLISLVIHLYQHNE